MRILLKWIISHLPAWANVGQQDSTITQKAQREIRGRDVMTKVSVFPPTLSRSFCLFPQWEMRYDGIWGVSEVGGPGTKWHQFDGRIRCMQQVMMIGGRRRDANWYVTQPEICHLIVMYSTSRDAQYTTVTKESYWLFYVTIRDRNGSRQFHEWFRVLYTIVFRIIYRKE